jgi:hypothetical protein
VAHRDGNAEFVGEFLQLDLPQPHPLLPPPSAVISKLLASG